MFPVDIWDIKDTHKGKNQVDFIAFSLYPYTKLLSYHHQLQTPHNKIPPLNSAPPLWFVCLPCPSWGAWDAPSQRTSCRTHPICFCLCQCCHSSESGSKLLVPPVHFFIIFYIEESGIIYNIYTIVHKNGIICYLKKLTYIFYIENCFINLHIFILI